MKVHKSTKVPCGQGTVKDVIEALRKTKAPSDSVVTDIKVDWSDLMQNDMYEFSFVDKHVITLEWDGEE